MSYQWLVGCVCRMCAPVMVELEGETDPLQIAMKELKYALSFISLLYHCHQFFY